MRTGPARSPKLSLFVFIDGFGWNLLQRHTFLNEEFCFKAPLETVFGYSSTCDPTILTGEMPAAHGHFSCFYYAPHESPFAACRALALLPKALTGRGRVRSALSRILARAFRYSGYFQIYNMPFRHLPLFAYSEMRDIYQPGGILGGQETIFDLLRRKAIPFSLSNWRHSEVANIAALGAEIEHGGPQFGYLFLAELDALLHTYGVNSYRIADKIQWYERELRKLLQQARQRYETVTLSIFSDHGMTNVRETCDIMARINRLGLRFGKDYVAVYDSTMARFWFLNSGARSRIESALREVTQGRILSKDDLAKYDCDFPDDKYGELYFLLNPGILLSPSFMGETMLAGMHGYDPGHADSKAMFASTFIPLQPPIRLDDLYGLMAGEALGVPQPVPARWQEALI